MWPFAKDVQEQEDQLGTEVSYWLVLSRIRVRGALVTTKDRFDGESSLVQDVHIELLQQGDIAAGRRMVRTGSGTQDVNVTLTADGRLQSVQHKSVGAGPVVVSAAAKLIGFVGGAVLSIAARGGGRAGVVEEEPRPSPPLPRNEWGKHDPDAARLLEENKTLALTASDTLVKLRTQLVGSDDVATARSLVARIGAVSSALVAARTEVARIETLYATWRTDQTQTHTALLECLVDLEQVAARAPNTAVTQTPEAPKDGELGYELWREFRLILQVVDSRREASPQRTDTPVIGDMAEDQVVRWRVPRTMELWVWSQQGAESAINLVTRTPIVAVDHRSDSHGMELRSGAFGEHGGTWTFGDDGAPSAITTNDKSMIGALADAFGSVPDELVSAVDQAKKLTESINGIQDVVVEREKVAAERALTTAKARIEVLGLNATEEDAAALARAEQAVKLRTATRSLDPGADALDNLKAELERAKTQNDLDAARRTASVEGQLADVKAEVARLEQEVLISKAKYDKLNPDKGD